MDTMESLCTRRSVRAYKPGVQVPQNVLDEILRAGTYAPNGMGRQSAVIVAVQDQATRDELSGLNAEVLGRPGDPFYGAPTVLVVLADPDCRTWVEDGSLVMGSLMNAAHALGVDSCWIHRAREVFDSPRGKELLRQWGLPETLRGVGHCILGYHTGEYPAAAPRKNNYIVKV